MNCILVYNENDIVHRQISHSSDELGEVTAEPRKVNLKNGIIVCQLRSVKRFLTNSVNHTINILCLFQHIIVSESSGFSGQMVYFEL